MKNQVGLAKGLSVSRIVHGQMRMPEWNLPVEKRVAFLHQLLELGINTIDQADIYGNYTSESLLGEAFKRAPELKDEFTIITKCGIALKSDKFPERTIKHYDYSKEYIVKSAEQSLENMGLEKIDVLLLHRPSPLLNPIEVAEAFDRLKNQGKVAHFGVSNFLPHQIDALSSYLETPLITNQIELSPLNLEHFNNGNLDFCLQHKIQPMSWSPLAGGRIFHPKTEQEQRVIQAVTEIAHDNNISDPSEIIYAWLLMLPSEPIITVGSGNINRIQSATNALSVSLSTEEWFKIYTASTGSKVP